MVVVKCGASGHNIRSKPSLKAAPVGMLALGNTVTILEYVSIMIVCDQKQKKNSSDTMNPTVR